MANLPDDLRLVRQDFVDAQNVLNVSLAHKAIIIDVHLLEQVVSIDILEDKGLAQLIQVVLVLQV